MSPSQHDRIRPLLRGGTLIDGTGSPARLADVGRWATLVTDRRMAAASMLGGAVTETPAVARLPGGPLPYTLRRSPRSRGLRVVIHPVRGVVVTVPAAGRRGWAGPRAAHRHLPDRARAVAPPAPPTAGSRSGRARGPRRAARRRPRSASAATSIDSASCRRGPACGGRPSSGSVVSTRTSSIVRLAPADRRSIGAVLEAWLKPRARTAIEREIAPPRGGPRRHPGRGQHPGPADALGERLAPGPAGVLVAARSSPRPRRSRRSSSTSSRTCASSATARASGRSSPRGVRITRPGVAGCATTRPSCTRALDES